MEIWLQSRFISETQLGADVYYQISFGYIIFDQVANILMSMTKLTYTWRAQMSDILM